MDVIIGCGRGKKAEPTPAAELYTSSYHAAARRWAESIGARVWVLSAKHGLIPGDRVIEPYSATFAKNPASGFAADTGPLEPRISPRALRATVISSGVRRAILLAGTEYADALREAAGDIITVRNPFADEAGRRHGDRRRGYQAQLMTEYAGRLPRS